MNVMDMRFLVGLMLGLMLSGCTQISEQEQNRDPLILKSLDYHGGQEEYSTLSSLKYKKSIINYDSSGRIKSEVLQHHNYQFSDGFEGLITEFLEDDTLMYSLEDGEYGELDDKKSPEQVERIFSGARFIILQPFSLFLEADRIQPIGKRAVKGQSLMMYQVHFHDASDEWFVLLDEQSGRVVYNWVVHRGRHSLIENLTYTDDLSLRLHKHRKSYFTDSLMQIQYLNSEYFYSDHQLNYSE